MMSYRSAWKQLMLVCLISVSWRVNRCAAEDTSQVPSEFLGLWNGTAESIDVSLALVPGAGDQIVGILTFHDAPCCIHQLELGSLPAKQKKEKKEGIFLAKTKHASPSTCLPTTFTFEILGTEKLVVDAKFKSRTVLGTEVLFVMKRVDGGSATKICKPQEESLSPVARLSCRLKKQKDGGR